MGPVGFVVQTNDIDECATDITTIKKFADDTKAANEIKEEQDHVNLQNCLSRMLKWAETWDMEYNVNKFKIMHVDRNNLKYRYTMVGAELQEVDVETNVGIKLANNLKPGLQCTAATG